MNKKNMGEERVTTSETEKKGIKGKKREININHVMQRREKKRDTDKQPHGIAFWPYLEFTIFFPALNNLGRMRCH